MKTPAILRFFFLLFLTNNCLASILSNIQNAESYDIGGNSLHIKRDVKQEKTEEKQEKNVDKKPWVPDVKSSIPKIAIAQGHCSLVNEFSLSLSNYVSDCHLLHLPIEFISKHNQKMIAAYLDSEKNELHEDQKNSTVCKKIRRYT